jgi:hypothetical protein
MPYMQGHFAPRGVSLLPKPASWSSITSDYPVVSDDDQAGSCNQLLLACVEGSKKQGRKRAEIRKYHREGTLLEEIRPGGGLLT